MGIGHPPQSAANATSLRTRVCVVAGGDEHLRCDAGADPEGVEELGHGLGGEGLEVAGVDLDLVVEVEPAASELDERVAHGDIGIGIGIGDVARGVEAGTGGHELVVAQRFNLAAEALVGGD